MSFARRASPSSTATCGDGGFDGRSDATRTRPGDGWIAERYFRSRDSYQWTFVDDASSRALIHVQQAIKQQYHIKVKAAVNPFDPDWDAYFRNREKSLKVKYVNEFIGKVLRRQNGECPACRQVLERRQEHCLQHIDGDTANRRIENVVLLHRDCRLRLQQAAKAAT